MITYCKYIHYEDFMFYASSLPFNHFTNIISYCRLSTLSIYPVIINARKHTHTRTHARRHTYTNRYSKLIESSVRNVNVTKILLLINTGFWNRKIARSIFPFLHSECTTYIMYVYILYIGIFIIRQIRFPVLQRSRSRRDYRRRSTSCHVFSDLWTQVDLRLYSSTYIYF